MRNKFTISLLVVLTLALSIYVKANQLSTSPKQTKYEEFPIHVLTTDIHKQFSRKYAASWDGLAMICQLSLVQTLETKDIEFLLLITYLREDKDYFAPTFLTDGIELINYVGSMPDLKQHMFQFSMNQWFYYMSAGFDGMFYVAPTDAKIEIKIPAEFFKDIDKAFLSWKGE